MYGGGRSLILLQDTSDRGIGFDAFEIARKQCWTLRTDYRDTLGPVAERHLQKKGVKHYAQDVVDLIADETFDLSVKRIEDGVLAEVSPR